MPAEPLRQDMPDRALARPARAVDGQYWYFSRHVISLEHKVLNRQERQGLQESNINKFDFYTLGALGVLGG
jgi:hypothetical protein